MTPKNNLKNNCWRLSSITCWLLLLFFNTGFFFVTMVFSNIVCQYLLKKGFERGFEKSFPVLKTSLSKQRTMRETLANRALLSVIPYLARLTNNTVFMANIGIAVELSLFWQYISTCNEVPGEYFLRPNLSAETIVCINLDKFIMRNR